MIIKEKIISIGLDFFANLQYACHIDYSIIKIPSDREHLFVLLLSVTVTSLSARHTLNIATLHSNLSFIIKYYNKPHIMSYDMEFFKKGKISIYTQNKYLIETWICHLTN